MDTENFYSIYIYIYIEYLYVINYLLKINTLYILVTYALMCIYTHTFAYM